MFCISEPTMLVGTKAEQKYSAERISFCSPISFFYWHKNKYALFLGHVHVYSEQTQLSLILLNIDTLICPQRMCLWEDK